MATYSVNVAQCTHEMETLMHTGPSTFLVQFSIGVKKLYHITYM